MAAEAIAIEGARREVRLSNPRYSVRPRPDARVSCPLQWDEAPDADPAELGLDTVPLGEYPR